MTTTTSTIKVLWIDDNPTQFTEFLDDAFDAGIDIDVCNTVKAGLHALENRNNLYEAVILDANCKIEEETEAPNLSALTHAIAGIYMRRIELPWFVYTGGGYEGEQGLRHIIPQGFRTWDEKIWYNKPDDQEALFDAIKNAVRNSKIYKLKQTYPEAFALCPTQELADLLLKIEEQDFGRNEEIGNSLRCILESSVCDYLFKHGIFAMDKFESSNKLKDCSFFFAIDKEHRYTPHHVQISFLFLCNFCNPVSHGAEESSSNNKTPNKIRAEIMAGSAPYINITAIHAAMSLFHWVASFNVQDEDEMKPVQTFFMGVAEIRKKKLNNKET